MWQAFSATTETSLCHISYPQYKDYHSREGIMIVRMLKKKETKQC